MDMLDFWCPENDDLTKCILIKVPKICCGRKTEVYGNYLGTDKTPTSLVTGQCPLHLRTYPEILENYNSIWKPLAKTSTKQTTSAGLGNTCSCGYFNDYAEANQSDGSYKCFNCR